MTANRCTKLPNAWASITRVRGTAISDVSVFQQDRVRLSVGFVQTQAPVEYTLKQNEKPQRQNAFISATTSP